MSRLYSIQAGLMGSNRVPRANAQKHMCAATCTLAAPFWNDVRLPFSDWIRLLGGVQTLCLAFPVPPLEKTSDSQRRACTYVIMTRSLSTKKRPVAIRVPVLNLRCIRSSMMNVGIVMTSLKFFAT